MGEASGRLGGMQADFVGTLGRKAGDVRSALSALEADPKARGPRDDVRRRLHAIGTAARLLHFDSTRGAIGRAEAILDRMATSGAVTQADLDEIGRVLDDLPVLAWEDVSEKRSAIESDAAAPKAEAPHTALVVGEDAIAMSISEPGGKQAGFECERTTDSTYAAVLAEEMSPDVVVVDGDIEGADELVETLFERSELAPIVVLGRFEDPAEEARFIALGVAKTLKKPAAEDVLYAACREAADQHRDQTVKITLPEAVAKREEPEADVAGAERAFTRGRGAAADVRLEGRRVLVADDDPGVTWFIADLLRTTGCIVHEAHDGEEALELAYKIAPHLILSDVLMPKLDGFQLARALKRDVALRDTPVILLSWKEDMLQRVRELGAGAAGYLRKESDARAILARVREALWPRARIEARLRGRQEVRGRLDGLTVRSLLELVCTTRPKSRICVRDASYEYELEIRDGAPCRASRIGPDGASLRGSRALAAMLGVWAGRFHVSLSEERLEPELLGTLRAQTAEPIAYTRGAAQLLSGARVLEVTKVAVDSEIISGYLGATPAPVRSLVERVAAGESPRQVFLRGNVDPVLLESALLDLASRGAIREIRGVQGEDLLRPAVDTALRIESGGERGAEMPVHEAASAGIDEDDAPSATFQPPPLPGEGWGEGGGRKDDSEPIPLAPREPLPSSPLAMEGSDTPMTSVAVRSSAPARRSERRWIGMAMFGVVAVAALGARLATDPPAASHAAAGVSAPTALEESADVSDPAPPPAPVAPVSEPVENTRPRRTARADVNSPAAPVSPAPSALSAAPAKTAAKEPQSAGAKDAGAKFVSSGPGSATGLDVAAAAAAELHAPNASPSAP